MFSKSNAIVVVFIGMATSAITRAGAQQSSQYLQKEEDRRRAIVGGKEIVPHSRPYLLSIGSDKWGHRCGASLISPHAVLTAAQCLLHFEIGFWSPPQWVDFHRHDLFDDNGVKRVYLKNTTECDGDAVYHPGHFGNSWSNDVAILFLPTPITDIIPVKLNMDHEVPKDGEPLDISGWGDLEAWGGQLPGAAHAATVNYLTNEACTKKPYSYEDEQITDAMMCASEKGVDTCDGDSGGPLVLGKAGTDGGPKHPVVQVGIASVAGCYGRRWPGLYTRVSEVSDWIIDTVCDHTGELCPKPKSAKESKSSKQFEKYGKCTKAPTYAPTTSHSPTSTEWPTPSTARPTDLFIFPTWVPTEGPEGKSGK